jgi:putative transposase
MIIPEDRQMAIDLIGEAVSAGARQYQACEVIEVDSRTLRRWQKQLSEEQELIDVKSRPLQEPRLTSLQRKSASGL